MSTRFSISPAATRGARPVTLVMPATGYRAQALVTDACGHPIPGASVTVTGWTATPHLPASWRGTEFTDWKITSTAPAPKSGAAVSMVLASRQDIGHPSVCHAGRSPYGGAVAGSAGQVPAAAGGIPAVAMVMAVVVVAILLVTAAAVRWLRPRGGHRAG